IARQQVALVAALRDRDEAREYLRERGNDVLQLRGELHESNTPQHALSEQVVKQNVEIQCLSALVESERVMRETAQGLQNVLAADGRRQDEEIRVLRSNLQAARHDLRLKEVQSNERMLANEALKKKIQEARGPLIQPGLQKVIEELKESEEKRQDLVKEAATSAAEIARRARSGGSRSCQGGPPFEGNAEEMADRFRGVAALRDEVIPKIEELRDRLVLALRNGVMGDEGLRGVVDFMNWSRDSFLVVGDLSGWVKAWHARAPFAGTVNVIGKYVVGVWARANTPVGDRVPDPAP
ncbi:unnamed protein product, partial [Aphanomyces euteiches]